MRAEPTGLLQRRRLVDVVQRRWEVTVALVVAPAGYGKTTLLTQAIAANAMAPVGVDCRVAAGTDLAVASDLATALGRALDVAVPHDAAPDALAAVIATAVWRRSPQQVCLTLDDVHEVPKGSASASLLDALVAALPTNGHLFLAGRTPPPIPMTRLTVEGRVLRVDAEALAFTPDELSDFAARRGVPKERVAGAGGWPALAELLASGTVTDARAYVAEEVLAGAAGATGDGRTGHLDDEDDRCRRHDLALLAHVGPFDTAIARAALGRDVDLPDLLTGLPLVEESPSGRYRLHEMWRPLLAGVISPTCVAAARRRAGGALRQRGEPSAAIRLFAEAGAWDDVAGAVVDALGAARPPVARDVVTGWLARLPEDRRTTPAGRLLAGVAATEADPEEAWLALSGAAAGFVAAGDDGGELACLVHLGELAWWSERVDRLAAVAQRVFELEAAGHADAVPLACIARALLHDVASDSLAMLGELDRILPGTLGGTWVTVVDALRATALLQLGNSADALAHVEEALAVATPVHAPLLEAARMHALWAQGRLDETLDGLPTVVDRFRRTGYRNATALAAAHCSMAHALRARTGEAAAQLASARAVAAAAEAPIVLTTLCLAEAALAVATGDEERAAHLLAAEFDRTPVGTGLSAAAHQRCLTLTYVLVAGTRPHWDAAELGPDFVLARDLARALVAVRTVGRLPADTPHLPGSGLAEAHLTLGWRAELAMAASAAERPDGARLIEHDWPEARPVVTDLAEGSMPERAGAAASTTPLRQAARATLARLPAMPREPLELRLLGPPELWRAGAPVDVPGWRRERVRSLLAHLVLHDGATRERVGDDLWPALDADAQSRNLRVTLTYLLQVLEPDRLARHASYFVRQHGPALHLHVADLLAVDVHRLDHACRQADAAERDARPADVLAASLDAVALWRGEPTELAGETWAVVPVEQRRLRVTAAAIRAGELLLARGALDHALELAHRAIALDPWVEGAHRLVVAALRTSGDHAGARHAMAAYREAIRDLGLTPDEATQMVERLLASDPHPGGPATAP